MLLLTLTGRNVRLSNLLISSSYLVSHKAVCDQSYVTLQKTKTLLLRMCVIADYNVCCCGSLCVIVDNFVLFNSFKLLCNFLFKLFL